MNTTKSMKMRETSAFNKFVQNLDHAVTASYKLREADNNHALKNVWRDQINRRLLGTSSGIIAN
jgi:hypothetical protein